MSKDKPKGYETDKHEENVLNENNTKNKGEMSMLAIKNIEDYKRNKSANPHFTLADMVFNKAIRECTYKRIDKDYTETEDEREIFEAMNKRRKRGD